MIGRLLLPVSPLKPPQQFKLSLLFSGFGRNSKTDPLSKVCVTFYLYYCKSPNKNNNQNLAVARPSPSTQAAKSGHSINSLPDPMLPLNPRSPSVIATKSTPAPSSRFTFNHRPFLVSRQLRIIYSNWFHDQNEPNKPNHLWPCSSAPFDQTAIISIFIFSCQHQVSL